VERTAPRDVIAYKPKGLFRRIGSKGDLFGYRELFYLLICREFWFVASKPTSALCGF